MARVIERSHLFKHILAMCPNIFLQNIRCGWFDRIESGIHFCIAAVRAKGTGFPEVGNKSIRANLTQGCFDHCGRHRRRTMLAKCAMPAAVYFGVIQKSNGGASLRGVQFVQAAERNPIDELVPRNRLVRKNKEPDVDKVFSTMAHLQDLPGVTRPCLKNPIWVEKGRK